MGEAQEKEYFGSEVEMIDRYAFNDIPFFGIINSGKYGVKTIAFENKTIDLKYKYMCITDKKERACFRFAQDAKMAAKYNKWKYIGLIE